MSGMLRKVRRRTLQPRGELHSATWAGCEYNPWQAVSAVGNHVPVGPEWTPRAAAWRYWRLSDRSVNNGSEWQLGLSRMGSIPARGRVFIGLPV